MKKLISVLVLCVTLASCGVTKPGISSQSRKINTEKANRVVDYAMGYLGTPYQYGGLSENGMDCSGLIHLSFLNAGDVVLPRISSEIAKEGRKILTREVTRGDLLFFKTGKGWGGINHLGLVVQNKNGEIRFIHSSTSRGVMISYLSEAYWKKAFSQARRVL